MGKDGVENVSREATRRRFGFACPRRNRDDTGVRVDILTIFPAISEGPLTESIMKRAQERGLVDIRVHNLRDWATDKHRMTDDTPYGGGPGMVMKPEPIFAAVEELKTPEATVVLMSPQGERLTQSTADALSRQQHLVVICGHYEGVDERVVEHLVDREISIGDYVLTNGAVAANVLVDAIVRLIPGVLGDEQSAARESFVGGILDHPQYTRPVEYRGWEVPQVLLSGNHAEIERWRRRKALEKTRRNRPDLVGGPDAEPA
jgi:tRNA (guanine37-N1)-methyltransferase